MLSVLLEKILKIAPFVFFYKILYLLSMPVSHSSYGMSIKSIGFLV